MGFWPGSRGCRGAIPDKLDIFLTLHRKSPTEPVPRSVAGYKVGNEELTNKRQ
jgi:hypothetical protein